MCGTCVDNFNLVSHRPFQCIKSTLKGRIRDPLESLPHIEMLHVLKRWIKIEMTKKIQLVGLLGRSFFKVLIGY